MNKSALYTLIFSAFVLIGISGCEDIFEIDVTDQKVELLSPLDEWKTPKQNMLFVWSPNIDAQKYNLQIVKGSFAEVSYYITDTLVTLPKFEKTLTPGNFEWRVALINGSSKSEWSYHKFTIEESKDITENEPVLLQPTNQAIIAKKDIELKWEELEGASEYRIEIHKNDWNGELVLGPKMVDEITETVTLSDGEYTWGVIAENSTNKSLPATRTLTIDTTAPAVSSTVAPAEDSDQTSLSVVFSWTRVNDTGSALSDSIFVSKTEDFKKTSIVVNELTDNNTGYTAALPAKGTYYWRLKTIDKAGNMSGYSPTVKFKVNF
ncbi:MAG: hypothetical protein JXA53_09285 [Bacteroidales bacterium]|nr:hypothetical protein [Bacteroidales bacterium]